MMMNIEEEIRAKMNIQIPPGLRRMEWREEDSKNVILLRKEGLTIRGISDVLRCSTRMVQDVLKGSK